MTYELRSKSGRISVSGLRGPAGTPGALEVIQASEAIAKNDFVNVYNAGGNLRVRKADATNEAKFANGFAVEAIGNGASGTINMGQGRNPTVVAAPAAEVWLSVTVPGGWQTTRPIDSGQIVQSLGPALPGRGIHFTPQGYIPL